MQLQFFKHVAHCSAIILLVVITSQHLVAQPRQSDNATFYTFNIQQSESLTRVTVQDVKYVKGTFKIPSNTKVTYDQGLLIIKVTDKSGNVIFETSCNNPLDQHIEHVNDKGELDRTRVQLTAGTFDIRIPFDTHNHTISVYVVDSNNRLVLLSSF